MKQTVSKKQAVEDYSGMVFVWVSEVIEGEEVASLFGVIPAWDFELKEYLEQYMFPYLETVTFVIESGLDL